MIKAIFLDIDGTMVSFKTHRMPEKTKNSLREARKKGVKVFVATGRFRGDINNLDDLEFDGYISLNGAYCWMGDTVICSEPIPKEDVESFVRYCREVRMIPTFFTEENNIYINCENKEINDLRVMLGCTPCPIKPMEELVKNPIFQMTAFFPVEEEPKVMKCIPSCFAARWYPTFADVISAKASKAIGIRRVCEKLGIRQEETMAFGDGGNDIPMIRYAGIGVAMGNADDFVKQSADYVTATVDDDGVGTALRKFGVI